MSGPDSSTDKFLETARADLQRQLAPSAQLDKMAADVRETGVQIRARVIVGHDSVILTGSGASLADAYEALVESVPPDLLATPDR